MTAARALRIVVDADACPVKAEIVRIAGVFRAEVTMVASIDHRLPDMPGVHNVQVDKGADSVDLYIVNRLRPGDVLITQDFGLAALALAKQAVVLSVRGQRLDEANIDFLLARRHDSAKLRRSGGRSKGPRPFTDADRQEFLQSLTKTLKMLQES